MTPDYDRAATKAAEILIKYGVCTAPVDPIPIFKRADGFNVVTFTEMSSRIGMDRKDLISSFEAENHDAVSSAVPAGYSHRPPVLFRYNLGHPLV